MRTGYGDCRTGGSPPGILHRHLANLAAHDIMATQARWVGIAKLKSVRAMAGLLHTAQDVGELQYLLHNIRAELRDGIAEIDQQSE